MYPASLKLKKKGFDIGHECYIFFNGVIVRTKIINGDFIPADNFLNSTDTQRPFVETEVLQIDRHKLKGWDPYIAVNVNQLYSTYEDAEKHRKKLISVNEFIEGNENVHKNNIIARIKVKTLKEYNKLKDHIDETYIINDDEDHIYENIKDFPCVVVILEHNGDDILEVKKESIIKKFENFKN